MDSYLVSIALMGIGATAVMDLWLALLSVLGMPGLNFAYLGRWAGHLARGRWRHDAIAKSAPIPAEKALGWIVHYAVGIAFACGMALVGGGEWMRSPTLFPALSLGIATAVAPLLVLQPAMGAGIASSRTAMPVRNSLRSVVNHAVFGLGLFLAAAYLSL